MPIPPPNSGFGPALALALLALALPNGAPAGAPAPNSTSAQSVRLLLVPAQEAKLSSPMAARIERITLQESERFQRGQALVVFDCEIQRAELHKAQAEVGAAEKTHASNVKLQTMHSISTLEVDLSAAQLDKARAELAVTRARVEQCEIRAPFDGRVVELLAHAHETVALAQPLLSILDDSHLRTELIVPSRWITWLKPGTPFTALVDETGRRYPARVKNIGARVDPASQSIKVTGEIEGPHQDLLAGMSGVAEFAEPAQRAPEPLD